MASTGHALRPVVQHQQNARTMCSAAVPAGCSLRAARPSVAHQSGEQIQMIRGASAARPLAVRRAESESAEPAEAAAPPEPRDDDVLPDNLTDAIFQASASTCQAIDGGNSRVIAEVLLGEFWDPTSGAIFSEEGDQQRFWKLTRKFSENLVSIAGPGTKVRALYPDMGVAAMLKNQWTDATFSIGSLGDRTPFTDDDDIIVLAAPDPQGVAAARRIAASAEAKTIVMFNPRLASSEVGIGLNVRRMVNDFVGSFTVAFSLRPIGDIGTVFRRYPGQWQVFLEDPALPGRYQLAAERPSRPGGEALDIIISEAFNQPLEDGSGAEPGLLQQVGRTLGSMQRFMKSLSS